MRTTKTLPWPRKAEDGTPLGIDLGQHYTDLLRIIRHKVPPPYGVSFEDWEQDVVTLILTRNRQPSAFDPRKGTLSTYIVMVATSLKRKVLTKQHGTSPWLVYVDPEQLTKLSDCLMSGDGRHHPCIDYEYAITDPTEEESL